MAYGNAGGVLAGKPRRGSRLSDESARCRQGVASGEEVATDRDRAIGQDFHRADQAADTGAERRPCGPVPHRDVARWGAASIGEITRSDDVAVAAAGERVDIEVNARAKRVPR